MNDSDRQQWVANDEGLYSLHRYSRLPIAKFVKKYRTEIDAVIKAAKERKPAR